MSSASHFIVWGRHSCLPFLFPADKNVCPTDDCPVRSEFYLLRSEAQIGRLAADDRQHGGREIISCQRAQSDIRGREARIDLNDIVRAAVVGFAEDQIDADVTSRL